MKEEERFITSTKNESELEVENKLRPTRLEDYVGQDKIKNNLKDITKQDYVIIRAHGEEPSTLT